MCKMALMELAFYKLHIAGSDFILLNGFSSRFSRTPRGKEIIDLCDRRRGIGGEGLIILQPGREQQASISYYSGCDGKSRDNGAALLCAARFAFDFGLFDRGRMVFEGSNGADFTTESIDSRVFKLEIGHPLIAGSGKEIREDEALATESWHASGEKPVHYNRVRFSRFPAPALARAVVMEKPDPPLRRAFSRRMEEEKASAIFTLGRREEEIELYYGRQLCEDSCLDVAASLIVTVCNGSSEREAEMKTPWGSLLCSWEEEGFCIVSGMPQYSFSGDYTMEDDDGPLT